jgi:chaperone BCS1
MRKVNLLLHGVPGCGKSSIIKAIANYTKCNIVIIKLSFIKSDDDIFDILYNPNLCVDNNLVYIPLNKRIYVFEDIDAESKVTHKRKADTSMPCIFGDDCRGGDCRGCGDCKDWRKNDSTDAKTNKIIKALTSIKSDESEGKLTLSGLLNALDGVIEFNSIMVMTTNHIEKLDPALMRYGRFTTKIALTYMTPENAHMLIKHYYPDYDRGFTIPQITPATLTSYIHCSDNLDTLSKTLIEHNPNDI